MFIPPRLLCLIPYHCKAAIVWWFNIDSNNKTYVFVNVVSDLKNNQFFGQIFINVPQYQISGKSVQRGPHSNWRTDGHDELVGGFLYYANAPNKSKVAPYLSASQWATKQIVFRNLWFLDSIHVLYAFHRHSNRLSNEHFAVHHTACKNTLV